MIRNDLIKVGLEIEKRNNYYSIRVADWEKFFPLMNLPTEGPLLQFAQRNWSAYMLHYYNKEKYVKFDICICSTSAFYHTTFHAGDKITYFSKESFSSDFYCPYEEDDIRRHSWFIILNQFDYKKIFRDIKKTLWNAYFPEKSPPA